MGGLRTNRDPSLALTSEELSAERRRAGLGPYKAEPSILDARPKGPRRGRPPARRRRKAPCANPNCPTPEKEILSFKRKGEPVFHRGCE